MRRGSLRFNQLPQTFLSLLHASFAFAQTQQALSLNSISLFTGSAIPNPASFSLPSSSQLTVSVAICSSQASSARFFVSNSTSGFSSSTVPEPSTDNSLEMALENGFGHWTGIISDTGLLIVENLGDPGSFQVSVSNNGSLHEIVDDLPFLGDTTANQVIIFSPPFAPEEIEQPRYPNYTLPLVSSSAPENPPSPPTFNLVLAPLSAQLPSLLQTSCSLLNTSMAGSLISYDLWKRDTEGWRSQWLVDGLTPSTNYTAYVIQDQLKVSGPVYFVTKSAGFPCPLVHSLPYCASTAYAVPLPPPQAPAIAYDATSLPKTISDPLLHYVSNFTAMLLTFACGRDLYSPLQTCADCQYKYLSWLCSVSFPRCSEPVPSPDGNDAQVPLSALQPQPSGVTPRNVFFPTVNYSYASLLPCLETCNAVDRACPNFLGFKCPLPQFNADSSYGVGFIDGTEGGVIEQGKTGTAQDKWGNIWCNGS
ncbi:stretch-activated cation channel Mid1 [Phlebopus sp. FC_14]|nr:stretch-activated cation channel Mid1 [Phlebopus sp. FC_14]